ncbi:MAG: hypothetical protein HWE24_15110 [Oceanospirillaceae bacterium]|nr:hypothetical protein [Oceanospirillaceae bacterium]
MAEVGISLEKRLHQRILLLITVAFFVIVFAILYFVETQNQTSSEENLALKHQVVEQAFNSYLIRAEGEMQFIAQDLALSNYASGRELDLLFSHHDVLFFGGLDFFYIEWKSGKHSMDPRARLFTKVNFETVLQEGLINRWSSIVTDDGSMLLMYKKPLISSEQDNIGFLYGFISLNDNLTLANELLESAQVSAVRVYDNEHKKVLLEEHKLGVDLSGETLYSHLPLVSPVQADLQLDITQIHNLSSALFTKALPLIVAVFLVLLCLYFVLLRRIKTWLFQPLESIVYQHQDTLLPYAELRSIQMQSNQYKSLIKAKEQRFELLTESVHSALIFCNEVAEVELINAEAKRIFTDADKARTLFDFLPISCHQPIQDALKGAIGVTFELTINHLGRIYRWQAYSFENESAYRGLLLVGRNVTEETSLIWQLEQLEPLSSAAQKKVDAEAIINELSYLSELPGYIEARPFQGWLSLLVSVLNDISDEESNVEYLRIGEVFCQESARVIADIGVEANKAILDCSVETGSRVVAVDNNVRSLMRVIFMMVMSNDMEERRLTIRFNGAELEIIAMNDMIFRPLFYWMVGRLVNQLGGQQKTLQNNALQLNIMMREGESELENESLSNKVVAWVANDYSNASAITMSLMRLGVHVEEYISTDSFFTQFSAVMKFDVVLIGCDKDFEVQTDMTRALKLKYNRDDLPIVWLNSILPANVEPHVFTMQGCSSDYSLYKVLSKACELEGIVPIHSNEQNLSWVIVGGSRISKAIWYTELEQYDIATQWLADLENYDVVLSYHPDAIIVLLEVQPECLLRTIQLAFPDVRFFSVLNWPEMPDNVAFFEMALPYSGDQIRLFKQEVMQQDINLRSKE